MPENHFVSPSIESHSFSFESEIRAWGSRAPWFAISAVFHALIILALFNVPWQTKSEEKKHIVAMSFLDDPEIIPELPPEIPDVDPDPIDPPIDPTPILLTEIETPEEDPSIEEQVFDSPSINNIIGVGSGRIGARGPGKYGIRGKGGSGASQKAVDLGLNWLYRHQSPNGSWGSQDFVEVCTPDLCAGEGHATHDVGVTGLALLAFLGAEHYPDREGRYQKTVRDGLRWLVRQQGIEIDGLIGQRTSREFLYGHAIATLVLSEAYGLSGLPIYEKPAQKALDFISRARNPYGAWRYSYPPTGSQGDNDVSVTGWMLIALSSANDFGLKVDPQALSDGMAYIDSMTDPATGRTGYIERGGYSSREIGDKVRWPAENGETMTAVSMMCRTLLTIDKNIDPVDIPALKSGAQLLAEKLPRADEGYIDYYYWYYGSYAMYQMSGRYWDLWSRAMEKAILPQQVTTGDSCSRGSWPPGTDPWGNVGGRVYSTALAILCLEVYYRYDKILGAR